MAPQAERPPELVGFLSNQAMLRWRDSDGAVRLTLHALVAAGRQ
jgi:hypothetical protein